MRVNSDHFRNHEGVQYWEFKPFPEDEEEERLLVNWREFYDLHDGILHTFFDEMDKHVIGRLKMERAEGWEYLPLDAYEDLGAEDSEWPSTFIVYEIRR